MMRNRTALTYSLGNIFNTFTLLLLLPTLLKIDPTVGKAAASGLLVSQIAAVLANYSFPVVTPRSLTQLDPRASNILLKELFVYQFTVGVISLCLLLAYFHSDSDQSSAAVATFFIGYSSVLQWQWFHITRETGLFQSLLLLCSRCLALMVESAFLLSYFPNEYASFTSVLLLSGLIALPVWSTVFILLKNMNGLRINVLSKPFHQFGIELMNGKDIFFSSLLTSVYILGPSILVASLNPTQLVAVQQFDRLRISLSGLTGMLLSTAYPFLLKYEQKKLIYRFKRMSNIVVLPAAFLAATLLISALVLPEWQPQVLRDLHISVSALMLSICCAISASASNFIALTLLHPLKKDRLYRYAIVLGALLFLASIAGIFFAEKSRLIFPVMLAACVAEISILFSLWVVARGIVRTSNKE